MRSWEKQEEKRVYRMEFLRRLSYKGRITHVLEWGDEVFATVQPKKTINQPLN